MSNRRIGIWQGFAGKPWFVELYDQTGNQDYFWQAESLERIAVCGTHAEAIDAAHNWIKANPLAIAPPAVDTIFDGCAA